jgi:hypothetical protein
MKQYLLACLLAAIAGPAVAAETPKPISIGDHAIVTRAAPACRSFEAWDKLVGLLYEKDAEAAAKVMQDGILAHICMYLIEGEMVSVRDHSIMRASYCVREQGNPDCYWTFENALKAN